MTDYELKEREGWPLAVDPEDCGCTECLVGQYVPLDQAKGIHLERLERGTMANNTPFTLRGVRDYMTDHCVPLVITIEDPAEPDLVIMTKALSSALEDIPGLTESSVIAENTDSVTIFSRTTATYTAYEITIRRVNE